jgi:hypothetical protein
MPGFKGPPPSPYAPNNGCDRMADSASVATNRAVVFDLLIDKIRWTHHLPQLKTITSKGTISKIRKHALYIKTGSTAVGSKFGTKPIMAQYDFRSAGGR